MSIRLRDSEWFALGAAVACGAVGGVFAYHNEPLLQLAGVGLWAALGLLFATGALRAATRWRRDRWRALLLPALAAGGFVLWDQATMLGASYRDSQFLKELPAYERVVQQFRSGAVPPGPLPLESLPADLRDCCYRVQGGRDEAGGLFVEFLTGGGFPVKHSGWLYYAGDSVRAVARERAWYRTYGVAPHWYRISD